MKSRWGRWLCSMLSVAMAGILCGAFIYGPALLAHPLSVAGLNRFFEYTGFVLYLSAPGWLIASPFVLLIRNYHGWRTWFYLAAGSCIGPILALVPRLMDSGADSPSDSPANGIWNGEAGTFLFAGAMSSLTTLIYLALVHWSQPISSAAENRAATGKRP